MVTPINEHETEEAKSHKGLNTQSQRTESNFILDNKQGTCTVNCDEEEN